MKAHKPARVAADTDNVTDSDTIERRCKWTAPVPKDFMHIADLSYHARFVWMFLFSYASPDSPRPFPARRTLMRVIGMGKETLKKYLRELTEKGYLERKQRRIENCFSSNSYILCDEPYVKIKWDSDAENSRGSKSGPLKNWAAQEVGHKECTRSDKEIANVLKNKKVTKEEIRSFDSPVNSLISKTGKLRPVPAPIATSDDQLTSTPSMQSITLAVTASSTPASAIPSKSATVLAPAQPTPAVRPATAQQPAMVPVSSEVQTKAASFVQEFKRYHLKVFGYALPNGKKQQEAAICLVKDNPTSSVRDLVSLAIYAWSVKAERKENGYIPNFHSRYSSRTVEKFAQRFSNIASEIGWANSVSIVDEAYQLADELEASRLEGRPESDAIAA